MRAHLRTMLDQFGIRDIQFANSAGTAIRKLRDARYDLILSEHDLGDDNQDGQHLLEDLRSRRIIPLETLFIMISGERSYASVVGAAELAPNDYILKPLTPSTLLGRIERAVDKREAFLPAYRQLEAGQHQDALASCAAAEVQHPAYRVDFMRMRADIHFEHGQFDLADGLYQNILEIAAPPWARLGRARVLIARRQYTEAEHLLNQLVAESEHYLDAYDLLALCRELGGHAPAACATLNDALQRSPRRLGRLRRFGKLAETTGELEQAEQALRQVVHLGKRSEFRDPADHVELVKVQILRGHTDEAAATVQDLEKSMGNQPGAKACAALGKALIFRQTGNEDAARAAAATAARALADGDDLPLALKHDIVRACLATGLDTEGSEIVGEILRHAPDEQTIQLTRALLNDQGRKDLSERVEERLHAEVRDYVAVGAKKAQAGDYEGAVSEMLGAVRKMPGNPHVLFNAALALLRHIEHNGWNERLAEQARTLIVRTRKLDPQNAKLEAMVNFMAGLERKYGMQPQLPGTAGKQPPAAAAGSSRAS